MVREQKRVKRVEELEEKSRKERGRVRGKGEEKGRVETMEREDRGNLDMEKMEGLRARARIGRGAVQGAGTERWGGDEREKSPPWREGGGRKSVTWGKGKGRQDRQRQGIVEGGLEKNPFV